MTTIYLSSTYEDLKEYREVVYKALRNTGYDVIAMEDYVAADQRPVEKCLADVAIADIYVGIFAFSYGYVPAFEYNNPDGLSITELELRHAERCGKPVLAFVLSDGTPWPAKFMDVASSESSDPVRKLRKYLLETKTAQVFSLPSELAQMVLTALVRIMTAGPRVVPVDGNPSMMPLHSGDERAASAGDGVFVCYARKDERFVLRLAANLKRNGVPIWLDQWNIAPGADWDRSIDNAIYDCGKFIIVLSPHAVDSSEVRGELRTALDERKPIIPVISAVCRVPRRLRTIQHVDFLSHGPDDEATLRQLMNTLATATDTAVEQDTKPTVEAAKEAKSEPTQLESKKREDRESVIPGAASNAVKGSHTGAILAPKKNLTWFQRRLAIVQENYHRGFIGLRGRLTATVGGLIIGLIIWLQWPPKEEAVVKPPAVSDPSIAVTKIETPKVVVGEKPVAARESKEETKKLTSGRVGPVMVVVPAGSFQMGDLQGVGDKDELPVRSVQIPKSFALSRFEVTFDEYDAFAKATNRKIPDDQGWGRGRRPVINVSWEEAQAYAKWLSEQTGKRYRLPTEAKWEYAARSGAKQQIWSGTSGERELEDYSWFVTNSGGKTQEVGKKKANGFGLHDMSGNVWEWVEDCSHDNYNGAPTDGRAWQQENGGNCGQRVFRGGSWINLPVSLRSSARFKSYAGLYNFIGIRLAQDLE